MNRMIVARVLVAAPADDVFAFLADLDDHWLLAGRFIDVVRLDGPPGARHGGRVRMKGPLGVRRTAATSVEEVVEPTLIAGTAKVGEGTEASVRWELEANGAGTDVTLSAEVTRARVFDQAVLAGGGAWWMQRRFESILEVLRRHFDARE